MCVHVWTPMCFVYFILQENKVNNELTWHIDWLALGKQYSEALYGTSGGNVLYIWSVVLNVLY